MSKKKGFFLDKEVLDWLNNNSANDIGKELMEFAKNEYSLSELIDVTPICDLFWASKGIEESDLPVGLRSKMQKAKSMLKVEHIRSQIEDMKITSRNQNSCDELNPLKSKEDSGKSSLSNEDIEDTSESILESSHVPNWLKSLSSDEIGKEILEFAKKEFPFQENINTSLLCELFWAIKGIVEYDLAPEWRTKMRQGRKIPEN